MATCSMGVDKKWPVNYLPRSVRVVKVIEVVIATGAGTDEDPFKLVTEFWDQKGELLAQRDGAPADLVAVTRPSR